MTVLRTATTAALALGTLAATLVTAQPAQAANHLVCAVKYSARNCVGIQTTSSDVRGYASVTNQASSGYVTVRSLVLQRRVCGGAWQNWTSVKTTGDGSRTQDVDVTTYVLFPERVQFRSVMTYVVESSAAIGETKYSPAYGSC